MLPSVWLVTQGEISVAASDPAHGSRCLHPHVGRNRRGARPGHEIYLTDPNRVAPEKLKTVLRQLVRHLRTT
jgi:hypothetical protein